MKNEQKNKRPKLIINGGFFVLAIWEHMFYDKVRSLKTLQRKRQTS